MVPAGQFDRFDQARIVVLDATNAGAHRPTRHSICWVGRRRKGIRILFWEGEPMMSRSSHDIGHHIVIVEGDIPGRVRI
jgi:hypothetical protein